MTQVQHTMSPTTMMRRITLLTTRACTNKSRESKHLPTPHHAPRWTPQRQITNRPLTHESSCPSPPGILRSPPGILKQSPATRLPVRGSLKRKATTPQRFVRSAVEQTPVSPLKSPRIRKTIRTPIKTSTKSPVKSTPESLDLSPAKSSADLSSSSPHTCRYLLSLSQSMTLTCLMTRCL
jgi:hypothetical protein